MVTGRQPNSNKTGESLLFPRHNHPCQPTHGITEHFSVIAGKMTRFGEARVPTCSHVFSFGGRFCYLRCTRIAASTPRTLLLILRVRVFGNYQLIWVGKHINTIVSIENVERQYPRPTQPPKNQRKFLKVRRLCPLWLCTLLSLLYFPSELYTKTKNQTQEDLQKVSVKYEGER